jgi:serine/threonine protein kinase
MGLLDVTFEKDGSGNEVSLGQGSFGQVKVGIWDENTRVAVKVVAISPDPKKATQARRELTMLTSLNHPNIVHTFGECKITSSLGIVMEYVPNGNLLEYLNANKSASIDWAKHLDLAHQITAGVAYLHSRKIMHRDLKSLNVLIDAQGKPKLCDFGLAIIKGSSRSHITANQAGTCCWMAPELFAEHVQFRESSDVYALAMIFVELCTFDTPFSEMLEGRNPMMVLPFWLMSKTRPKLPETTPADFKAIIEKAWAQDESARPSAREILGLLKPLAPCRSPPSQAPQSAQVQV